MIDFKDLDVYETQAVFNHLNDEYKNALVQVEEMRQILRQAEQTLDDLRFRRGKAAYWLTIRKGQH